MRKTLLWAGAIFVLVIAGVSAWIYFDPERVFLREVEASIEKANAGGHLGLLEKLSPEMESYMSRSGLSVPQALALARKMDADQKAQYRLVQLELFQAGDYAEIEVERSGPNGDFADGKIFPVPFVYRDGDWLVAGSFREERKFINPFSRVSGSLHWY